MMSFCRNSVNSFLGPEDFSQAFHQTPCDHPTPTPSTLKSPVPEAGYYAGDKNSGEGSTGFTDDIGLMSCTESLGFESSDEISTLDDLGTFSNYNSCKNNSRNEDSSSSSPPSSSSSCSSLSSSFYPYNNSRMNKWTSKRTEKKNFPPPLTSLRENGRRDFVLRPVRENGRLEIVGVMIDRPEILCASRKNGRLTLHLVKSHPEEDEDDEEEETGEEREKTESEKGVDEETEEEETGEEREWKIAAAGLRRCYQREMHVWGQQQQRCVTTM